MLQQPTLDDVERARARTADFAIRSPLVRLNQGDAPADIYLKLECLQPYGSFKVRAAANALLSIDPAELREGVYTGSAGNFGQGLAAVGQALGVPVTVYAPETSAKKKLSALESLGAEVCVLSFTDWWQVLETRSVPGATGRFIHPVAESAVIAGNGVIGLEILEDLPDVDTVMVPFGGGGLIAGIGAMAKDMRPDVRIIGCESEAATPLAAALRVDGPVDVPHDESTFINGIGSTRVLADMWPCVRAVTDEAVSVPVDDVANAVRTLVSSNSVVAEGAGATPVAAALAGKGGAGTIVCIVSGGNIDPGMLADILKRQ